MWLIFVYAILADLPPVWCPIILEISASTLLLLLKVKLDVLDKKEYTSTTAVQTGEGGRNAGEGVGTATAMDRVLAVSSKKWITLAVEEAGKARSAEAGDKETSDAIEITAVDKA